MREFNSAKAQVHFLTQLTFLTLKGNKLTDVTALENLTQLTILGLKVNTSLAKAQIDQLQKALPKWRIIWP